MKSPDPTYTDQSLLFKFQNLLNTVKDCGFNVNLLVVSLKTTDKFEAYYSAAENIGMPTIVSYTDHVPVKPEGGGDYNTSYLENAFEFHSRFENNWGYYLADEPTYRQWGIPDSERKGKEHNLTLGYNTYRLHSHGKHAFFCLKVTIDTGNIGTPSPNLDEHEGVNYARYKDYLERIYSAFHPMMLAADIYPIAGKNKPTSENLTVMDDSVVVNEIYYPVLRAIGEVSREKNIPFWLYMLSNQHTTYRLEKDPDDPNDPGEVRVGYSYPYPTVGTLRFQAMNALAFGIQGLVFWTYTIGGNKPFSQNDNRLEEEYFNAPFINGKKTPIWDRCQTVISEIKHYGKVLLDSKFQAAVHVYKDLYATRFPETRDFMDLKGEQFGCIKNVTATGYGFVITHLTKDNKNFIAIVSHDFKNSQQVTLYIDKSFKCVEYIEESTGLKESLIKTNDPLNDVIEIERQIPAGGMLLLSY